MAVQDTAGGDHGGDHDGDELLRTHHRRTLWIPWTVVLLGVWLLTSPVTFGYRNDALWTVPSGGRGVWFSDGTHDSLRSWLTVWSDVASGALLLVLGLRMLRPGRAVATWAACFVGIWLVFAPVVLWAPTASAFLNDSVVGTLVIALTILIPGMPNMPRFMTMGGDLPPGWSYNPSSWPQRAILIGLGFAGLIVSRYLAAYQLGYVEVLWDPFFGFAGGTQQVLDSQMSHTWPISDAGLGAVAYTFELLMGYMGGTARWRTMPWMVTIFGILVIPLGLAHIALVMSQPVVVHEWCTMCLLAASIMLPMIPLEIDEVVAMVQHVRQARRRGDRGGSTWKVFWLGGEADGATGDERSPALVSLPEAPRRVTAASVWGMSAPWGLVVAAALGVGLLVAPAAFGVDIRSGAADVAHIGGAAILVTAVVAMGEVVRTVRLLNLALGVGVAGLVWVAGTPAAHGAAVTALAIGAAAASAPRGPVRESYATWTSAIS
jgi:uncharacterized membrane protein